MIRFAVIGTNWISDAFCQAAHSTGHLQLSAVYSRHIDTAKSFASKYQVDSCFTDLEALAASETIDAVYIASPNSLHAQQAELFMNYGKHAIVEKPMASNIREVRHLISVAQSNNVVLFEALKTRYLPNLNACRAALSELGTLRRAHLTYCQYSSRYPKYLNGENPNTFNPAFSNGSLMDIGIYPLTAAIELFGKPLHVSASGALLPSGVDAHGTVTLTYEWFEVLISHSKVSDGCLPSDIQGEKGSLLIEHVSECPSASVVLRGEQPRVITESQVENTMLYEVREFAELVRHNSINHDGLISSQTVHEIMTTARQQVGIVFPADH